MTAALVAALAAQLFAAVAWLGTIAGERLCAGRVPNGDGPPAVAYGRAPFAAAGACIGAALVLHGESPAHLAVLLAVIFALAGAAAADLACGALPDLHTVGPLVLVIATRAATFDWAPAFGAVCVAVPFAFAALFSRGRGMGWGDVKLAALGGALLGIADAALAFMLAALVAYGMARRSGSLRRPVAFGPYLAASIAASLTVVRTI